MSQSSEAVLQRAKVREVTGVFHSYAALSAAVGDLLRAGFDRADIDRVASLDEIYRRLGAVEVAPEELPDVPDAPRQPFIARDDITTTVVAVASTLAAFGAMIGAFIVLASGGGTGGALIVALIAAVVAGGIGFVAVARYVGRERREGLDTILEERGLILWLRVRSPEREETAMNVLRNHGARAVRVHEIALSKTTEDLPLGSLRPDPWLGPEKLGEP